MSGGGGKCRRPESDIQIPAKTLYIKSKVHQVLPVAEHTSDQYCVERIGQVCPILLVQLPRWLSFWIDCGFAIRSRILAFCFIPDSWLIPESRLFPESRLISGSILDWILLKSN